jgi:hypothetical protein
MYERALVGKENTLGRAHTSTVHLAQRSEVLRVLRREPTSVDDLAG